MPHTRTHIHFQDENVETVVAEVSNTPWNEMHCYVLSPNAKGVQAKVGQERREEERQARKYIDLPDRAHEQAITKEGAPVWNYVFQKEFHVSPFMEMAHTYDWDFRRPDELLWVVTHMLRQGQER